MSRKNMKLTLVTLLACTSLLLTALGCESGSPLGPDPNSTLSPSDEASFSTQADNVGG
jgi:hypothetical protein